MGTESGTGGHPWPPTLQPRPVMLLRRALPAALAKAVPAPGAYPRV